MLCKQNFHEYIKKVFEPVTKSIQDVSEEVTKTKTETSQNNNKALEILNNKHPEILNDRGILPSYFMSPLSKVTNTEFSIHFILVKNSDSNRVNDLKINKTIPITLYKNLLTFRDTGEEFETNEDLLTIKLTKTIM